EVYELGRIFLHLAQRRGYFSNRKTDKAKEKDTKGMLGEINVLDAELKNSGLTLGSYFAEKDGNYNRVSSNSERHIRRQHTKRQMYIDEFDAIWTAQQQHYPEILTDTLKYGRKGKENFPKEPKPLKKSSDPLKEYGIYGIIFFQRKMYWPKSVVGRCELEPHEKRCPRAARIAQRFRMVQEVNNLMFLDHATHEYRSLSQEEREKLLDVLSDKEKMSFDDIRKNKKMDLGDTVRFNFESGGRNKLDGHKTDHAMAGKKALGKRWKEFTEVIKDKIVDIILKPELQDEEAVKTLVDECGLTEEEGRRAILVPLPESYMSYSEVAIRKLLPFMEQGYAVLGQNEQNSAIHAAGYLRKTRDKRSFLPPPPEFTNPLVRQAMFEARKTINAILRELVYGQGHTLTHIHVELAREAKKSFAERKKLLKANKQSQSKREDAKDEIAEFNSQIKPTRATINRYLLWKEQGEDCPYCGRKISPVQLFNGDADVDHILPRWRSLDDSMANKVVAHRTCNQEKGDQTPRKWLERDPERYQVALKIASKLPFGKQKKFQQEEVVLDEFVNRQLTDTAYISRCVSQYLQCLGAKVVCTRGQMTSDLRYYWGLNTILNPEGQGGKNREDHRHHAVDAIVIGLTDSKRLFALANQKDDIQKPWPGFREDAEKIVKQINVSHKALRKLRGALHEETFYGATQKLPTSERKSLEDRPWAKDWIEVDKKFVRRKAIDTLKKTQDLDKVRDPAIREILREHLRKQGIDPDAPGKIGDAFKGENLPKIPSGISIKQFLKLDAQARREKLERASIPIKKVRMIEPGDTMRIASQRRCFQYVKPGNNHH
ncbi:MAG: type II CRISPR RNA-guided endonuclease Cas9, partial [Thermoguttaceae bacterium]